MSSKREKIGLGEYCHIYNRGTDKRLIFNTIEDMDRFVESIGMFNTIDPIISLSDKKKNLRVNNTQQGVGHLAEPLVEIVAYSLLPNHFHFLVKQAVEGGISEFMKRLQGGYTNYFNIEHERSGALFQGKYKYKHVSNDEYFRNIFYYVTFNANVHNLPKNMEHLTLSSFKEYVSDAPHLVSKVQMNFIFDIFKRDVSKIKKYGIEFTSIIKQKRLKEDYKVNKDLFE